MSLALVTERLVLRLPRPEDAEPVAYYLNDFEVAGNLARVPFPYRLADAKAWLRTRHADLPASETSLVIEIDGEASGIVGFHTGGQRQPVIGYWLGRPFWGRGIMTEAVTGALDWYFPATGHAWLTSGVFYFNQASLAIQRKLGFTIAGQSSLMCLARGQELRHIDTQLTRATWMARRSDGRDPS